MRTSTRFSSSGVQISSKVWPAICRYITTTNRNQPREICKVRPFYSQERRKDPHDVLWSECMLAHLFHPPKTERKDREWGNGCCLKSVILGSVMRYVALLCVFVPAETASGSLKHLFLFDCLWSGFIYMFSFRLPACKIP